ncbi:MAG: tRNA (adenosine(37)-N6)-threonylcarbamoyltransferase complex ATPase subunit type 1 TsaE [Spirochaetaceae bacterium]|nr:tRNA (adenosine(37)-N6)-threonylcarbamoyltransferase complex ATPase subunit type 1 TsaE [Spirochaetaceae bacterium]
MLEIFTNSAEETILLGNKIGKLLEPGDIIAMQGTLAAGKTTFTKGIAQSLAINETITSPTFTLISEYEGIRPLYHMDVYRLNSEEEFIDLGVEDLMYSDGISIIEWSEKVMGQLPKKTIIIHIEILENDKRKFTISNFKYEDKLQS